MLTASHIFKEPKYWALKAGKAAKAYISMAVLRARKTGQLRLVKYKGKYPPKTLPKVEMVYTKATGRAMSVLPKPYSAVKKAGNQNK